MTKQPIMQPILCKPHEIYTHIAAYLPQNPVIVEAGSFQGQDALKMQQHIPHATIHCFEPVPEIFAVLEQNTAHIPTMHRYACALSDQDGTALFHCASKPGKNVPSQAGSLHAPQERRAWSSMEYTRQITVPTIRLDTWARDEGIKQIDFLWLDMQGHELHALKGAGALLDTIKLLYVELHFIQAYEHQPLWHEIVAWLAERGFHELCRTFENRTDWFFGNMLLGRMNDKG